VCLRALSAVCMYVYVWCERPHIIRHLHRLSSLLSLFCLCAVRACVSVNVESLIAFVRPFACVCVCVFVHLRVHRAFIIRHLLQPCLLFH
jgi:hypothetical protein